MTRARDVANIDGLLTTTGDTYYASAAGTPARLGIGSTSQVLTVASGVPSWATPTAGGTANWSLLNAGGTALSGSQTVTVSGISGANQVMVIFIAASLVNASDTVALRINTDTTTKYSTYGTYVYSPAAYVLGGISQDLGNTGTTYIPLGTMSGSATSFGNGYCLINGANATGIKTFQAVSGFNRGGNDSQVNNIVGGLYTGTSTISSISMYGVASNFDAGTVYVYTTA